MKANEFVKRFGIDDAREYLCGASFWEIDGKPIAPSVNDLKRIVGSHELVMEFGGLDRVKKALDGKHIGYTHFYLHSNGRYVFLDHYVDFIPDHAQHIGMFNKAIADVERCL